MSGTSNSIKTQQDHEPLPGLVPEADPFLTDLFPALPPDEVEQWIKIHAHKAEYLREHPERGRGKASKRPKLGLIRQDSYAHYIAEGAKRAGYKGFSETSINRIIARVLYFGVELLRRAAADPRRRKRKRTGFGDFLDKVSQRNVGEERWWPLIDEWLRGLPPRIVLASIASTPAVAASGNSIDLRCGDSKVEVPRYFNNSPRADIIVTDPPYGLGGYSGRAGHDAIEDDEDSEACSGWSVPLMWDALKDGGTVYLFTCWQVEHVWRSALLKAGFTIGEVLVWNKVHASGSGAANVTTLSQHELIIVAHKGTVERQVWKDEFGLTARPGKDVARDVSIWEHAVPRDRETREGHPTPKPVELMMRALLNHSRPGDLVLDMFAGSGPVALAARRLGRRYIGWEKHAPYHVVANENFATDVPAAA